jgi:hypothetical protein
MRDRRQLDGTQPTGAIDGLKRRHPRPGASGAATLSPVQASRRVVEETIDSATGSEPEGAECERWSHSALSGFAQTPQIPAASRNEPPGRRHPKLAPIAKQTAPRRLTPQRACRGTGSRLPPALLEAHAERQAQRLHIVDHRQKFALQTHRITQVDERDRVILPERNLGSDFATEGEGRPRIPE